MLLANRSYLFEGTSAPRGRIYVLRPAFSEALAKERPALLVDGVTVANLGNGQFVTVEVEAGRRVVSISPRAGESSAWRGQEVVEVRTGELTFVALWNIERGETTTRWTPIGFGASIANPQTVMRGSDTRFEKISAEQAMQILSGMTRATLDK